MNNYPKLHNATWAGMVGKGPGAEPVIDLETMLDLTAAAEVDGVKFDGVDLFLYAPHFHIDGGEDEIQRLAEKVRRRNLAIGTVVAPVYGGTGGGSPMGTHVDRQNFLGQVRKACHVGRRLREIGVRPYGTVRIDSVCSVAQWNEDPENNQRRIADTFRDACAIAEDEGERLAAEGEICWGGMHSWRRMIELLEMVDRPQTLGFQADMSHTLLYLVGYNAPEDALLPLDFDWNDRRRFDEAYRTLTMVLRPWTIDFHVAQNDGTVYGSGSHDKTGRHCMITDPNGKLDVVRHAGYWLRDASGQATKSFRHICWDGCMFPNATMMQRETWNNILHAMIGVRREHGWQE
ncbi:MAG: sugar phosphate isomerase/epimerase [Planctomycetaceae bacterium]|nr:sugar phosphate isomerase/epimerase [Planctomycetaceae bacterium]